MPAPGQSQMDKAELKPLRVDEIHDAEDAARLTYDPEEMEELEDSMKRIGLIDPILVMDTPHGWEVLDGQRRLMVARELGWRMIRCLVVKDDNLAVEAIRLAQNQQHQKMPAWEEYVYYSRIIERMGLSFLELCKVVGKSEDYVSDRLRLGALQPETQQALANNLIPFGAARELGRLKDRKWELYYLDSAIRSGSGTVVVKNWVSQHLAKGGLVTQATTAEPAVLNPTPPEPVGMICPLCNKQGGGRLMMQVWIHTDELNTVAQLVRATFAGVEHEAEVETPPAKVEG